MTMTDPLVDRLTAAKAAELVDGQPYSEWRPTIEDLIADGDDTGALNLLIECLGAIEDSCDLSGDSMPTWYTSTATWLARRRKDPHLEAWFYQRWEAHETEGDRRWMYLERHRKAWQAANQRP